MIIYKKPPYRRYKSEKCPFHKRCRFALFPHKVVIDKIETWIWLERYVQRLDEYSDNRVYEEAQAERVQTLDEVLDWSIGVDPYLIWGFATYRKHCVAKKDDEGLWYVTCPDCKMEPLYDSLAASYFTYHSRHERKLREERLNLKE